MARSMIIVVNQLDFTEHEQKMKRKAVQATAREGVHRFQLYGSTFTVESASPVRGPKFTSLKYLGFSLS